MGVILIVALGIGILAVGTWLRHRTRRRIVGERTESMAEMQRQAEVSVRSKSPFV